jgi:hypothetical protein
MISRWRPRPHPGAGAIALPKPDLEPFEVADTGPAPPVTIDDHQLEHYGARAADAKRRSSQQVDVHPTVDVAEPFVVDGLLRQPMTGKELGGRVL